MKKIIPILLLIFQIAYSQTSYYINDGSDGDGSYENPWSNSQWTTAMSTIEAGDTLHIMPGTYSLANNQAIIPVNNGTPSAWITIKAYDPNDRPIIKPTSNKHVLLIQGVDYYRWESIEINGDWYQDQLIFSREDNGDWNDGLEFYNCKIHRGETDGMLFAETNDILIDSCEVAFMIRWDEETGREDAHAITLLRGNKITVNNCNIHHTTGDGIQNGSTFEFWDTLIVTNCHIWCDRLDSTVNGAPAGTFFGENGIDTKTPDSATIADSIPDWRAFVYIDNCLIHGYNGHYDWPAIAMNMAVDATIKNTVVYESAIGYRLMGPYIHAQTQTKTKGPIVKMINCISYDTYYAALWPENNVDSVRIWNCTFDNSMDTVWWPDEYLEEPAYFDNRTDYNEENFEVRNTIFIDELESYIEDYDTSTYIAHTGDFVDRYNYNYQLVDQSGAIDSGRDIDSVITDIEGTAREEGACDYGAYENTDQVGDTDTSDYFELSSPGEDTLRIQISGFNASADTFRLNYINDSVPFSRTADTLLAAFGLSDTSLYKDTTFLIYPASPGIWGAALWSGVASTDVWSQESNGDTTYVETSPIFEFTINSDTISMLINTKSSNDSIEVVWGDGEANNKYAGSSQTITHKYASSQEWLIKIYAYDQTVLTYILGNTTSNYTFSLGDLPSGIMGIRFNNANINGNLSDAPNLTYVYAKTGNTIGGSVSDFNASTTLIALEGNTTVGGNHSDIPSTCTYYRIVGNNQIDDYTSGTTFNASMNYFFARPAAGYGLSSAEVDSLLLDLNNSNLTSATIDIAGNNAVATWVSSRAIDSLESRSCTINVNEALSVYAGPDQTLDPEDEIQLDGWASYYDSIRWRSIELTFSDTTILNPTATRISEDNMSPEAILWGFEDENIETDTVNIMINEYYIPGGYYYRDGNILYKLKK